jgi:hypothetical protein
MATQNALIKTVPGENSIFPAAIVLDSVQQAAATSAVVRVAYFVEFQFRDGTQRLSTLNIPSVTWGGHSWAGLGTLGVISSITESETLNSSSLSFTLNAVQPSWFALATGDISEYRGLKAKLYFCPLDTGFNLINTPVQCWNGVMDMVTVSIAGTDGTITLKCETSAYGLKRANSYRTNAAQQKKEWPNDTGFDYQTDLITNPAIWLTIEFQKSIGPYANV